jgi:hypothetical protein
LQQSLGLQAAQQGVERALIHLQALVGESFEQRVAVLLFIELAEHRQADHPAP